jgi:hypothetical protein
MNLGIQLNPKKGNGGKIPTRNPKQHRARFVRDRCVSCSAVKSCRLSELAGFDSEPDGGYVQGSSTVLAADCELYFYSDFTTLTIFDVQYLT